MGEGQRAGYHVPQQEGRDQLGLECTHRVTLEAEELEECDPTYLTVPGICGNCLAFDIRSQLHLNYLRGPGKGGPFEEDILSPTSVGHPATDTVTNGHRGWNTGKDPKNTGELSLFSGACGTIQGDDNQTLPYR